ncbi:alpha-L-rhamnosidase C-terminal domain-containing protein [Streptomyces fractus]|uniref:alpha-L-rhamnosidase-related protein n=1 Tax=Streptomyces fractus TaxID=641806 RepID=UPI003CF11CA5
MPHHTPQGPGRRSIIAAGAGTAVVAAAGLPATAAAALPGAEPGEHVTASPKAPAGRWDRFNLSPASRTVRPVAVHSTTGKVTTPEVLAPGQRKGARGRYARLSGQGSTVTLDFGKEVGGFVTLHVAPTTTSGQTLGLTYAELSTYISATTSDGSNGGTNHEPPVRYSAQPGTAVRTRLDAPTGGTPPGSSAASQLRGGFRYLTVINTTDGDLDLTAVEVDITFAPNVIDLRAYPNYFHCDDDLLNRIWYAGAYTVQTNIIACDQGRVWGPPETGWNNAATVGEQGATVLVDGAKRDRTVWPGDLGISVLTDYVSLGDLGTVRNSLRTLYNHQAASGALPYAGPAVNFIGNSDAYHLWTLIGTALYVQLSSDTAWLASMYDAYRTAMAYIVAKLDTDGLLNVTSSADWARGDSDGKNLEANAIMYRALVTGSTLAVSQGDTASAGRWTSLAAALKSAVEKGGYWDEDAGLYRDKPSGAGAALYPQDGNALAVWFGLVPTPQRAAVISERLAARWTGVGAPSPEKSADSVHPFPGGMEVHAHFLADHADRALDLIRRQWGFMLNTPTGTASTFWEGYRRDGTSDYGGSYMSAAHGWSTAPTSALTCHFLGIVPAEDGPGHVIAPHPGDHRYAEGRLVTSDGVITVSWHRAHDGDFTLTVDAPAGAVREIAVPLPRQGDWVVRWDAATLWRRDHTARDVRVTDGSVRYSGVQGGRHTVTVRPA